MIISNKLSFSEHIDDLLMRCSQSLLALRTLRFHGMPSSAIQTVYQATVIAKLSYAAPAWWGYTTAFDCEQMEAFLRRSIRQGYHSATSKTLTDICSVADERLFTKVTRDNSHLLHCLLPQQRSKQYSLRTRSHNYQLPKKTSVNESNFIMRLLYKDSLYY